MFTTFMELLRKLICNHKQHTVAPDLHRSFINIQSGKLLYFFKIYCLYIVLYCLYIVCCWNKIGVTTNYSSKQTIIRYPCKHLYFPFSVNILVFILGFRNRRSACPLGCMPNHSLTYTQAFTHALHA